MMVPKEYCEEEKEIKLTQSEIDLIIEELERTEHNLFLYLNYDKIINKLKGGKAKIENERRT